MRAALRGICLFSARILRPRCASRILPHLMRLVPFVLCLAFCVSMLRNAAGFMLLCQALLLCFFSALALCSFPGIDSPGTGYIVRP